MAVTPVEVALIGRTAVAVHEFSKWGVKWIGVWARGKRVVIVGPGRTGKTTLFRFLTAGTFLPEKRTRKTKIREAKNLVETAYSANNKNAQITIRIASSIPGQAEAIDQAEYTRSDAPHILFVVLDVAQPLREQRKWLQNFFDSLEEVGRERYAVRRSLKSINIVINKADTKSDNQVASRVASIDGLTESLEPHWFKLKKNTINTVACVMVKLPPPNDEPHRLIELLEYARGDL
ncbi:MAG: GTPase domain-containing protein [Alphaproteobacteria bacterium]|jgi:GTPase SAR1 family protein